MPARTSKALAAALVAGLLTAACTGPGGSWLGGGSGTAFAAELERFGACGELRDYFVDHAVDMVGPYGLEGPHGPHGGPVPQEGDDVVEESGRALGGGDQALAAPETPQPEAARGAPTPGEDFSTTNVQEAGVDEPDVAKTDGRRLVTVSDGRLHVLDVSGGTPAEVGSAPLPDAAGDEVLLAGDRALVLGQGHGHVGPMASSRPRHGPSGPTTTLVSVDLAGEPEVAETLRVDGAYVSARLVDGVARIVLRTRPVGLDFTAPEGSGVRAEREATERNREIVEESGVENWLPSYVREGPDGDVVDEGLLVDCTAVHHPDEFAGLGLAAVFALDPTAGLDPVGAAGVVGAGETVYATADNLYVAMPRGAGSAGGGLAQPEAVEPGARDGNEVTTSLHRFSIADPDEPTYAASGEVPGRLLDQWALSEHDGHLRVATTEGRARGREDGPEASESAVRVLDLDLEEVGSVEGLGVGERIYAVRYVGDIGYVVTFREIDPLYTIDLSEPSDPAVLGELKITGYSGYLHPLGDDRLLGVGQEADREGRTRGAQASVFDVADLANPRRVDQLTFPGGHTAVEHDHRALLHWPPEDLLVMPLEQERAVPEPPVPEPEPPVREGEEPEFEGQELPPGSLETGPDVPPPEERSPEVDRAPAVPPQSPREPFSGAVVLRVDGDQLVEVGRVSHPSADRWSPPVQRALVVGDVLYTVGPEGVLASDLDDLDEVAWIRL